MRWRGRERELGEEINTHLEMATRDRIARGERAEEARTAALREFGNVALVRQTTREMWPATRLEHLLQDLRFGARILRQAPALSLTAVLLLALVIGGNTTVYAIVSGLLVSPAVGVTADRLVAIKHVEPGVFIADPFVSFPNYEDYARRTTTLEQLTAWSDERLTVGTGDGSYAVHGALVTSNYFETLAIAFAHGRSLQATDDESRDGVVAVISERLWRERFAHDPNVIGRIATINGVSATVIGVTAAGSAGALRTPGEDVWMPIRAYYRAVGGEDVLRNRAQPLVCLVGKRRRDSAPAAVRAEFDAFAAQLRAAYPESLTTYGARGISAMKNPRVSVSRYSGAALLPFADMAPRFLAVFSVVTLLTLVVVCANVANLLLGRAVERQRDTAVRRSLGASRLRVTRMLLAEGATLALAACLGACLFAWWTSRLALQLIEPAFGLLAGVRPDWTLIAYAVVLAAVATTAFSAAPAMRAWHLPVLPLLKSGEQSVARGRSRGSSTLVVVQLAFSVLLLTSAGLAYRALSMLDSSRLGFVADNIVLTTLRAGSQPTFVADAAAPPERATDLRRLEEVRERLTRESGVTAVSYSRRVPGPYALGRTPVRRIDGQGEAQVYLRPVGADYLRTLGLTPLAGRELLPSDGPSAAPVAVISQALAHDLFPAGSALGERLRLDGRESAVEIVGVAPDALYDGPVHDPRPRFVFIAQQQVERGSLIDLTFYVRHDETLDVIVPRIGRAIAEVDPTLPIVATSTMTARLEQVTVVERQVATLLAMFAAASLIVAALGQYSVAMFNMRRRTRDFGVRLALGASADRLQRAVLVEALVLAIPGLLIGLALSAGVAVALRAVLFGVAPVDPLTYVAVGLLLALTSVVASYLPAWRAGRVNVMEALRQE